MKSRPHWKVRLAAYPTSRKLRIAEYVSQNFRWSNHPWWRAACLPGSKEAEIDGIAGNIYTELKNYFTMSTPFRPPESALLQAAAEDISEKESHHDAD